MTAVRLMRIDMGGKVSLVLLVSRRRDEGVGAAMARPHRTPPQTVAGAVILWKVELDTSYACT